MDAVTVPIAYYELCCEEREEAKAEIATLRAELGAEKERSVRMAEALKQAITALEVWRGRLAEVTIKEWPAALADPSTAALLRRRELERQTAARARITLSWALDLIDKYDALLVQLGGQEDLVYSDVHSQGLDLAHKTLAALDALDAETGTTEEK